MNLNGYYWPLNFGIGLLVIDAIVTFSLLCCIVLQTRFRWVRYPARTDKLRNWGYEIAVVALISTYILKIVDSAFRHANANVSYDYLNIYIFSNGLWRIADILILAIIYRTIAESSLSNLARRLLKWHRGIIVLVALNALATWSAGVAALVYLITEKQGSYQDYGNGMESIMSFTYHGLFLPAGLLAGLESWLVTSQVRSKICLIMLSAVVPALILRSIFVVLHYALIWYNNHIYDTLVRSITSNEKEVFTSAPYYIQWVFRYLAELSNTFIYGGVVLIGWLSFRKGAIKDRIEQPKNGDELRDVPAYTELLGNNV